MLYLYNGVLLSTHKVEFNLPHKTRHGDIYHGTHPGCGGRGEDSDGDDSGGGGRGMWRRRRKRWRRRRRRYQ